MKIKISQSQLNLLIKEQEDTLEKSLSGLEYAIDKPFSCVEYEPITINGKKSFPKNRRKSVIHTIIKEEVDKIFVINIDFIKEWKGTEKNIVLVKIGGEDKNKRSQQVEYAGTFHCTGRDIVIDLDPPQYYQAREDGSMEKEHVYKQPSPISPNPFVGTIPGKEYKSLNELGKEIEKITFDFSKLNPIV